MLDREHDTTQARESTPKTSDPEKSGAQPDQPENEPAPDKKSEDHQGAPSDGPKSSRETAKLVRGGPPPSSAADHRGTSADPAERWGDLPEKARDVFRSQGGVDLPVRYREWIDAYYRRLNR